MVESIGTIKSNAFDTFEIIVDEDDTTVFLAPIGEDSGIVIELANIDSTIKLLQKAKVILNGN